LTSPGRLLSRIQVGGGLRRREDETEDTGLRHRLSGFMSYDTARNRRNGAGASRSALGMGKQRRCKEGNSGNRGTNE
jgi:hypothetical protein